MIGNTISHYKILEELGRGGMGVVYKAEDTKLQRHVALKFLPQEWTSDPDAKARFMNEARAASALEHNNICNIHEIDETGDGQLFIAMAFYEGETVHEQIERGPLKLDRALDLATQIAEGLDVAHQETIVHRDLKPANVLVTDRGVAKILDFGLAKLSGQSVLTKEGTTLGTTAYMSPEQARGEQVDHRTDIFSFGVLLYEMVTGKLPFKGDYEQAVIYSIMNEEPEPLTALRTGVPMDLERAVFKCLEKAPDERYQSATDLLVDLKKLQKGLDLSQTKSVASVTGVAPAATEARGKSKVGFFALGTIGVAGLIALFFFLQKAGGPKPIRLTNPQKVTHSIGVENYPTWSPDGTRIAYAAGGDIWVKQLSGGEPVNMTADNANGCWWPSWSPDGSQIAFIGRQNGRGILVMPAIGGMPSKLAPASPWSNPAWSADGMQLALVLKDSTGLPGAEIYTLSTYERRKVALPGEQFERSYLSWSPGGDFFAYSDADNLYRLADISVIKILRIADGKSFQLENDDHLDFFPIWPLDGRILYFISDRGGTPDVWQVKLNAEGEPEGHPQQLSFGLGMESLAFSPDQTKIAFSREERTANLWRIPVPKPGVPATKWAKAQQLTFESSRNSGLDLSPDGKRIYFESDRGGNWDVWSMPVVGGEFRQLTTAPEDDNTIHLSADGNTLAFVSERSGKREIWTMPAIGGPAKQITSDQSPRNFGRDGRRMAKR